MKKRFLVFLFCLSFSIYAQEILFLDDSNSQEWQYMVSTEISQDKLDKILTDWLRIYAIDDKQIETSDDFTSIPVEKLSGLKKYQILCWSKSKYQKGFLIATVAFDFSDKEGCGIYQTLKTYTADKFITYHITETYKSCIERLSYIVLNDYIEAFDDEDGDFNNNTEEN